MSESYGEKMFDRFTDRARKVVVLAQQQAFELKHNYIGTEHILLGLLAEEGGVARTTLTALHVDLDKAKDLVREIIGVGNDTPIGHLPFTPRAKKVLELALREALQLGHNYVGTEHILLGLLREGEGVGAQVLQKFDITLNQARQATIEILSGYKVESSYEPPLAQTEVPITVQLRNPTDIELVRKAISNLVFDFVSEETIIVFNATMNQVIGVIRPE